jgi:glycosyltransferase involved in cell wall biosynthesis
MTENVMLVTPIVPSFRANGLAMRAASIVKILSEWSHSLNLVIVPLFSGEAIPDREIVNLCRSWHIVSSPSSTGRVPAGPWTRVLAKTGLNPPAESWRYNDEWQEKFLLTVEQVNPALVVVFRFYLGHFVIPALEGSVPIWLDVDELESKARDRLAALYEISGNEPQASKLRAEALAYQCLESNHLGKFQRIFASSKVEAASIRSVCPDADVRVLPNVYPADLPQPPRNADGRARFLYVGTLGYYPNRDAINYFCAAILPQIRRRLAQTVEIDVIGTGLKAGSEHLFDPDVHLIGAVPQTTQYYADCDVAIVPLRAAGGTRIKILEAFSHQRAVISTSIGAEGLETTPNVHLRIADSPEEFADHCVTLIHLTDERLALAGRGHEFFKNHHTQLVLQSLTSQLFG